MDCAVGTCVLDRERGVADDIWPNPWQTDTCIGQWHYKRGQKYKTPKESHRHARRYRQQERKSAAQYPAAQQRRAGSRRVGNLGEITKWMAVNSEGIYGTRPWKIYGEGPGSKVRRWQQKGSTKGKKPELTAEDVRFTTKGSNVLYAFVMGCRRKARQSSSRSEPAARRSQERSSTSGCWASVAKCNGSRRKRDCESRCRINGHRITLSRLRRHSHNPRKSR